MTKEKLINDAMRLLFSDHEIDEEVKKDSEVKIKLTSNEELLFTLNSMAIAMMAGCYTDSKYLDGADIKFLPSIIEDLQKIYDNHKDEVNK